MAEIDIFEEMRNLRDHWKNLAKLQETELTRLRAREAKLVAALTGLVARHDAFKDSEGNMEAAYYALAKHAQKEWEAARKALAAPDVGE